MSRTAAVLIVGGVLVAAGLALYVSGALAPLYTTGGYHPNATTPPDGPAGTPTEATYDHVTVTVVDAETNATLGTIRAAVAETDAEKYTGLSKTDSLPPDRGMLFVYDQPGNHTYVMRNMSFGIDIVYVDADGTITAIHHAPEPGPGEDGSAQTYPGYGQYVLEVNYNWTTEHGIEVGDRVLVGQT